MLMETSARDLAEEAAAQVYHRRAVKLCENISAQEIYFAREKV